MNYRNTAHALWVCFAVLALMASPANAGPLIAAVGALGTAISSSAIGSALLGTAISYGVNYLISAIFAPEPKVRGIKDKLESGGDNPLSFIMGEYATAGKLVYVNEVDRDSNIDNPSLVMVISLSELPVSQFSTYVWINGERCTVNLGDIDGQGFYLINEYKKDGREYCRIKFYDGNQTTADSFLLSKFGSDPKKPWTSAMVGRGCAYAIVKCRYSTKGIWAGVPEFKFVVRGIPLYDIRKDSTNGGSGAHRWTNKATWEFSDNPVVMKYNIIRGITYGSDYVWGGQESAAFRLPAANWIAAANVCDELVTRKAGGTLKRYVAGCEIAVDSQPLDVIKELDKSSASFTTEYGGTWRTQVGVPSLSVLSITDDDIIISEDQSDDLFKPVQETYNGAQMSYIQERGGWVPRDAPRYLNTTYQTQDGGDTLIADIQLPFVTEDNQAQRLGKLAVDDSRRQRSHVIQLPPWAYILEPFDVVTWTSTRNNYTAKKFMVTSIDDLQNCNQLVAIREIDSADYGWNPATDEKDVTIEDSEYTEQPNAIKTFTLTASQIDSDSGKDKPAIDVTWTWGVLAGEDIRAIRWQLRRTGTTKIIGTGRIDDIEDNASTISKNFLRFKKSYDVRLTVVTNRPFEANWTAWQTVVLVDLDAMAAPTLEAYYEDAEDGPKNYYLQVNWTDPPGEQTFAVRIKRGARTWYRTVDAPPYTTPVTVSKTYDVAVRAIGADGTKGDWSPESTITINKKSVRPAAPTSLTVTPRPKGMRLVWNECLDRDYNKSKIYRGTTASFGAAQVVGRISGTHFRDDEDLTIGTTYYYWVSNVDNSGNESHDVGTGGTAFGPISGVYTGISDLDNDQTAPTVPTNIRLDQLARDVDGDGRVDIAVKVTWSAVAAGVSPVTPKAVSYGVKVTQGSDVSYYQNDDTSFVFQAKASKAYTVQVRAISFAGAKSAYGSVTNINGSAVAAGTAITPAADTTAPATPSGFAIVPKARGMRLTWTDATEADYKRTLIYRNTVNNSGTATLIARIAGTHYLDTEELTVGTVYYYWIKHRDQSGNDSAFSTVQSASHRGAVVGDVEDNAVTTGKVLTGNVTKRDQASNYGTKTVGTTYENVGQVTANHGANAEGVTLLGQFRCNNAGSIQVRITKGGGGTIVLEAVSMLVENNEWVCIHDNDPSVSGSSTSYDLEARISTGTLTVEFRKFTAISFKR